MHDLVCPTCGITATYAEAAIIDREGETHDWVEPINNGIDVV